MTLIYQDIQYGPFRHEVFPPGSTDVGVEAKSTQTVQGSGVQKRLNWKHMDPVAKNAPVPYWKQWTKVANVSQISLDDWYGPPGHYQFEHSWGHPTVQVSDPSGQYADLKADAAYKAKAKLLSQMKGEGTNVANMIAERKQTAKAVIGVANQLINTVRDLRHGNLERAIRRFGGDPVSARELKKLDIANQWIALQYGWKPLLSDVYGLVNQLHVREMRPKVFRCSSKSVKTVPNDSTVTAALDPFGKPYGITTMSAICKYMIRAQPNRYLSSPQALGFTDPLTVLWEVTPWSFVVDWILPIGTYLGQLSASHGWDFHDGCVSTLNSIGQTCSYSIDQLNFDGSGDWSYALHRSKEWQISDTKFERGNLTDFPSPDLPQFKNPLSFGHVANSIALLAQQFAAKGVGGRFTR